MNTFRKNLTDYLIRVNQMELIAEGIRQSIAQNKYFQIETVFQRMDAHQKGYLTPTDFSEFMAQNKSYPRQDQLYIIFRAFDSKRSGTVTLTPFDEELLPRENKVLAKDASSRKFYNPGSVLQVDLEFLLMKYLRHKISQHNQLQVYRSRLFELNPLFAEEAFDLIDSPRNIQIEESQIDQFCRKNGKVFKEQQIKRIYRVLSFNDMSKLVFSKFREHISPLSKGFYLGYADRMIEKEKIYTDYLEKKLQIEGHKLQNSRKQLQTQIQLEQLRLSNRRFYEKAELQLQKNLFRESLRSSQRL